MASPKGDQREQVRAAAASEVQRWERLLADELTALWARQEAVVLVRLQGTKARKHTRHWTPAPAPAVEVKALDPSYIVDLARWILQAVSVVSDLLRRLYEELIGAVLKQLGFIFDSLYGDADDDIEWPEPREADGGSPLPAAAAAAARRAAEEAAARVSQAVARGGSGDNDQGTPAPAPAPARESDPPRPAPPRDAPARPADRDRPARAADRPRSPVPTPVIESHVRARIESVVRGVQGATEEVQAVIQKAEDAGDSVADIADKVRDTYRDRSKTWTGKVVNSNVVGAMNESSLMAATAAGVEKKQWLSSHDTRVRDSHREADGSVVAISDLFRLAGGTLAYPGDPSGPPSEVINCRCTLLFPLPSQPAYRPAEFAKVLPVYAAAVGQSPRNDHDLEASDG